MLKQGSQQLGFDLSSTENAEIRGTALGRLGTPEEIASVIAFLLSSEASFITGVVDVVDGSWVC